MGSENAIGGGIRKELAETLRVVVGAGTTVGLEGELSNTIVDSLALEFLLRLSNPSDLGMRVDDGRNGVVVDVSKVAEEHLNDGDTLVFGLVGEHWALDDVSDGADGRNVGDKVIIDDDTSSLVHLDANLLEAKTLGERLATNAHQDDLRVHLHQDVVRQKRRSQHVKSPKEDGDDERTVPASTPLEVWRVREQDPGFFLMLVTL